MANGYVSTSALRFEKCYPYESDFVCTSPFGPRNGSYHYGIDFAAIKNKTIVSAMDGYIRKILTPAQSAGYGNVVWIVNDDGSACLYAHLSQVVGQVGQRVRCRQMIGIEGSTGHSTGNHLHFGVSNNPDYGVTHTNKSGCFINPAVWLGMQSNPKGKTFSGSGLISGKALAATSTNQPAITSSANFSGTGLNYGATEILPSGEYYEIQDLQGVYSDWLYGRRYRVFVDLSNGDSLDVSELRCSFSVTKTQYREVNQSTLSIYNLNPEDENKIIKEGQRIIIEAGYTGDQYGIIFAGRVIQPIRSKEGGTDYVLTLLSMDEEVYASYGLVGVSLVAQQSSRDAINAALTKATYKQEAGILTDTKIIYPRGKVMFGNPKNFLDAIARSENATYYSDDGKVNIVSAKDVKQNEIFDLGPSSGLLGSPSQTIEGVEFDILINPRIGLNSLVHLDNRKIANVQYQQGQPVRALDKEGIYRVVKINYIGDTRGNDWKMKISAISQAGILPGMSISDAIQTY